MHTIDLALLAFVAINALRVVAYVPQMKSIYRDANGATAISCWSWSLFAASHLSTAAYAAWVTVDWMMAAIFTLSGLCCLIIIAMTQQRRRQFSRCNRNQAGATAALHRAEQS